MDFNSLYPSIIQEYNICFTTIGLSDESAALPDLPDNGEERGVLPAEMNRLIQNRKAVKQLLKEEKEKRPNSEKLKQVSDALCGPGDCVWTSMFSSMIFVRKP